MYKCIQCLTNPVKRSSSKCKTCVTSNNRAKAVIIYKSKLEMFSNYSWQNARTQIQRHAKKIYDWSDKPKSCFICGYSNHYEVCHISPLSKFSDNALVAEINSIDNLVALCPNHHWEYDNEIIKLK